jgi:hypothetical protein
LLKREFLALPQPSCAPAFIRVPPAPSSRSIEQITTGTRRRPEFARRCHLIVKPGGIQRLCVPDLEQLIHAYNRSLAADDLTQQASLRHDLSVADIFEQSVRRASSAAWRRTGLRLWLENLLIGDARARGETHQWMWDRVNVRAVLMDAGFTEISIRSYDVSDIEGWKQAGLERTSDGSEYKPRSMYVECRRPTDS